MASDVYTHIISTYFAPRGRSRMYSLGMQIAQQYLSPFDNLIGIIGEAGSGKSALIKGMFPGLELTNDDDGVNVRPLPLLEIDSFHGFFTPHTYHIDIRFETGFTQMSVLAEAITEAIHRDKRVVVEHFDLVAPFLRQRANMLIGVGEEIVITRPTIFGPEPQEIVDMVYKSAPYRLMAHTAEDLCELFMPEEDLNRCMHGDVRHGFTLQFPDRKPEFDILEVEQKVNEMIAQAIPVAYYDESHMRIGDAIHVCTGPRTHVSNTSQIKGFRLLPHFVYDRSIKSYLLIGVVGEDSESYLNRLDRSLLKL
ncbi:MAG: alanine-tRNA synthetase second additional domain-containing protein [Clostridia bacterium]|nr:alanine-tRNA synthetase second additional domain-containing protein [Clostridia bacterium]